MLFKYLYNNLFYEEEGHSMYTDISVLLKGSDERMAFTPAFEDFVKGRIEDYKELGAKQCVALNAELEKFASLAGDLPAAEWYVLDIVTTNLSYIGFGMNAEKVADIAGIFPRILYRGRGAGRAHVHDAHGRRGPHADRHVQGARLHERAHHV